MNNPIPVTPDDVLHSPASGYWKVRTIHRKAGRAKLQAMLPDEAGTLNPANVYVDKQLDSLVSPEWSVHNPAGTFATLRRIGYTVSRVAQGALYVFVVFAIWFQAKQ